VATSGELAATLGEVHKKGPNDQGPVMVDSAREKELVAVARTGNATVTTTYRDWDRCVCRDSH